MVSYLYRMPTGLAGDVSRTNGATIEPVTLTAFGTTGSPAGYGIPVAIDTTTGNARTITSADTFIFGLLVREYPTNAGQDALGVQTLAPVLGQAGSVLRRGYMTVKLSGSTAAVKGQPVYVWTAAASGSHIVGGFESTNPGGSGFALPNTTFEGPADASGIVEIAYNL
jgi:hypothetical protein